MKSQNQPEHERPSQKAGHQWLRTLQTIYHLKLWRILLILILVSIICYALSIWVQGNNIPQYLTFLRFIPWASLATTSLGVAIISLVYEWIVRNETDQKLDEVLTQHFQDQAKLINTQIPRAMLTTPEVMRNVLDSDVIDDVIRNSLEIRLEDSQLAKEAYESFLGHLLSHEERRRNYRCNIYLAATKSTEIPDEITHRYYDGFIDVRYDSLLQKDTFQFTCVETMEEYNDLLKDPHWELRWIAEPTKDFPKEVAFDVESVHVGGLLLNIRREEANGKYVIVADHLELKSMLGQIVTIYYRYKVKIKKRGHLLMIHMPCPTHNVVVELDYAHTDIHFVNVLDFFVSQKKPAIRYIPSLKKHHRIEVEVNDWVFPKGGVVFVWVLKAEMAPGFFKPSTGDLRRINKTSSKPGAQITHPLSNEDTEQGRD